LHVPINPTAAVQAYDIDMFDNTAAVVADLHSRGKKVICYIDVRLMGELPLVCVEVSGLIVGREI
jgi:hypothetical protein